MATHPMSSVPGVAASQLVWAQMMRSDLNRLRAGSGSVVVLVFLTQVVGPVCFEVSAGDQGTEFEDGFGAGQ